MIFAPGTHVFYETSTGKPIRVKQIYRQLDLAVPAGQSVYTLEKGEAAPNGDTDRMIDGAWVSIGAAPSLSHSYDWGTAQWILNTDKVIFALAEYRWQKETGGTTWNGYQVHTDRDARAVGMAEIMNINAGLRSDGEPWKFADGVFRPLTNADFIDMYATVGAFVRLCFACESLCQTRIASGEYDIATIWAEEWATLTAE